LTEDEWQPDEPVVVPITRSLDLHSFAPRDVRAVVDAYLDAALEAGFTEVRLIHGKGKGVQRAQIQKRLRGDPRVDSVRDAAPETGGWGATDVSLRPEAEPGSA